MIKVRNRQGGWSLDAEVFAYFGVRVGSVLHRAAVTRVAGSEHFHVTMVDYGIRLCPVRLSDIEKYGAQRAGFEAARFALTGKDPDLANEALQKWKKTNT